MTTEFLLNLGPSRVCWSAYTVCDFSNWPRWKFYIEWCNTIPNPLRPLSGGLHCIIGMDPDIVRSWTFLCEFGQVFFQKGRWLSNYALVPWLYLCQNAFTFHSILCYDQKLSDCCPEKFKAWEKQYLYQFGRTYLGYHRKPYPFSFYSGRNQLWPVPWEKRKDLPDCLQG